MPGTPRLQYKIVLGVGQLLQQILLRAMAEFTHVRLDLGVCDDEAALVDHVPESAHHRMAGLKPDAGCDGQLGNRHIVGIADGAGAQVFRCKPIGDHLYPP